MDLKLTPIAQVARYVVHRAMPNVRPAVVCWASYVRSGGRTLRDRK